MPWSEDKKERILDTARKMFARFGLKKCSVEEVSKASGVGKGTVYLHFSSKEELFASVVEREGDILLSRIRERITAAEDPAEQIRGLVLARFEHLQEMSNLVKVSQEMVQELTPLVEKARQRYFEQEIGLVREILEQGKRSGRFAVDDCDLAAAAIVLGVKGLEFPTVLGHYPGFLEQGGVDALVNILLKGIEA